MTPVSANTPGSDARAAVQPGSHRARMIARREAQLARTPDFTAMRNRRVEQMAMAALERAATMGFEGSALERETRRILARQLPMPAFVRRHRAPRPSKGDSAAWRKSGADIGAAAEAAAEGHYE